MRRNDIGCYIRSVFIHLFFHFCLVLRGLLDEKISIPRFFNFFFIFFLVVGESYFNFLFRSTNLYFKMMLLCWNCWGLNLPIRG